MDPSPGRVELVDIEALDGSRGGDGPSSVKLLWVILIGLIFALVIQSLSANLGVVTGRHLAELCKSEYPVWVRICLWLMAELAVIAADIPEELLIGTIYSYILPWYFQGTHPRQFFLFESGIALFVALLINICIVSVSGTVCSSSNLSPNDSAKCSDLSLDSSSFLLKVQCSGVWRGTLGFRTELDHHWNLCRAIHYAGTSV
ncbi:hypothetical protein PR202_gb12723 [Eleusine coracana subsp. coracana]|uniref:Uncharacterized protein n=1 Tax=Eleusine coracana subsp. coracana TaxID=191504 RepID=A0AAV5ENG7_ELECO|nr:hypothetical protein PR202_gb12723 [Eleusine coracana subsp. coracana]